MDTFITNLRNKISQDIQNIKNRNNDILKDSRVYG